MSAEVRPTPKGALAKAAHRARLTRLDEARASRMIVARVSRAMARRDAASALTRRDRDERPERP